MRLIGRGCWGGRVRMCDELSVEGVSLEGELS